MELNYKEFGQGEPVIILHGLFGTLDNWQTIARKLAEHYTVYIVDLRNHGRSPNASQHNYAVMSEDLRQFMESHWIYGAHIIGHSMGGKTAMQFALDHPDMVDKLVVVDISPKAYPGSHHDIFEAMLTLDLNNIESRQEAESHLAKYIADEGIRLFLMKNLTRKKEGGFTYKINLPVLHKHYKDILAAVGGPETFDGPVLFIRGGLSRHMTDEDETGIKALFPKARIETIATAGHWVHADAPEKLMDILTDFLAE